MTEMDYRPHLIEALRTIEELQARLAQQPAAEPIAIIGMGCRLPGGVTEPDEYWRLLRNGVDATGEFPTDRADTAAYFDPDATAPGKAHTMRGGFLGRVDQFEPAVFGISPREAVGMDPQHRLMLEVTWEALERAGYAPDRLEGSRTGVYLGVSTTDYVRLRQQLGDPADIDAYQLVGEPSFLAGRISYTLGLRGPSQVVDTACSSSLVAVHEACQALRSGECDLALAGGVNLMLAPYGFVLMSKFGALAPDGRCKTFDASADGYARGEGAGVIVLKRASEALADGDAILAYVSGSAINHDGRSSGMTVPNPAAQREVVELALAQANIEPARVDYVEAHGTGTSLGDPIELRALHDVLGAGRASDDPLLVGSAKTNIGHLEAAAGIAGLIKIVLAMGRGEIPPHLHFDNPNPNIAWDKINVRVTASHQNWPARGERRVAAVSSFGVSGTNAHTVLTSAPAPAARPPAEPVHETVFLHARSGQTLTELADRFARYLRREPDLALLDVAFTTQVGRTRQPQGLAVVADSVDGIADALAAYSRGGRDTRVIEAALPPHKHRRTAWLFTGQGSQYAGMAASLLAEPAFAAAFDEVAALLDEGLDQPVRDVIWPPAGAQTPLDNTRYTQPALFAIEYALAALWRSWGHRPAAVAGHSVGEITAAVIAGVLSLADAAKLVVARAALMSALPAGGVMLAVRCDEQTATRFIEGYPQTVSLAAVNSPTDVVISGAAADVAAVQAAMTAQGIAGTLLTVSHAFHSPLMRPIVEEFRRVLSTLTFHTPRVPIVSNVTGAWWTAAGVGPQYWIDHALGAVRFLDGVRTLHGDGIRTFLEIGPQPVLSTLGARSIDDEQTTFVASLRRGRDRHQLVRAVATVYLRGASIDWAAVQSGRGARRIPLPTTPWHGESYWFREATNSPTPGPPPGEVVVTEPVVARRLPGANPVYQLHAPAGDAGVTMALGGIAGLALQLARDAYGNRVTVIDELVMHQRVEAEDLAGGAQATLARLDEATVRCTIHAADPAGESAGAPWRLLAEAVLRTRPTAEQQMAIEADRLVTHDFDAAAGANEGRVLDCDVVAHVRREGDGVLFALDPDEDITVARVVDATLAAVRWAAEADGTNRAAGQSGIRLGGLVCADPARVRYVYASGGHDEAGAVEGSVRLYADGGACIGGAATVEVPAPLPPGLVPTVWHDPATLLYDIAWQPLPPASPAPTPVTGTGHLLIATDMALADQLAEELRVRGAQAVIAAPPVTGIAEECVPDLDALRHLVESWSTAVSDPARIILLTGLAAPRLTHTDARGLQEHLAVTDLLVTSLIQILGETLPAVRLAVVTRGAAVTGFEGYEVDSVSHTLWGLGRVVALEHPERWAGAIDLDANDRRGECALLVDALGRTAAEDQQAIRGGGVLVARLVSRPLHPDELARQPVVRGDGTYLVTGGFGGIGRKIATWLAVAGAGHIVLCARSPLPEREAWDGVLTEADHVRVDFVRRLELLGAQVTTVACDVVDDTGLARLFAGLADDRMPLRGIVHAAGISDPRFVRDVTAAEYRAVWAPKVIGGFLLHQLSGAAPELELFLSFSSVAAMWGSQHLASYAAGNAFLDGLAHLRQAQGLPALTVAWGPWDLPSALFDAEVMAFLHATGLRSLDPTQSLRLLGPLLAGSRPTAIVCAADWSIYKPVMEARTERPVLRTVQIDDEVEADAGALGIYGELVALAGTPGAADAARERIRALLVEVLTGVLGGTTIGPDDDIVGSGLDSLMAMEVVRTLKRELHVSVKASSLFERPTVSDWADLVRDEFVSVHWGHTDAAEADRADRTDPAWIDADVRLDPAIQATGPVAVTGQPRNLLLTGASGFVGAYLLDELLARTAATLHLLVRCDNPAEGLARIRRNVTQYLPWRSDADGRIVIVPGDLAESMLGLDAEQFAALAADCDGIFHSGAWVNFSYTYEQLRPANVDGTQELLRLATLDRTIPVHYVSTYGIWGVPDEGRHAIAEDEPIATAGRLVTGYVQTKWAAERLVEQARERGVPVDIYRLGRTLGDSRTGACLTTHFTTRVIKGCVQLGIAPDIDIDIEMTPVDYVAQALVGIALSKSHFGHTYHLINQKKIAFRDLIRIIRAHGWLVEVVPVDQWWATLRDSYGVHPNELHAVMGVVEEFVVGGEEAIDYGVSAAEAALAGTGIVCPPLDADLLHTYLTWLRDSQYLPAPALITQGIPTADAGHAENAYGG